jgi:glutathione synthase/RimK-type ligase-like ATP-grasp enzyme
MRNIPSPESDWQAACISRLGLAHLARMAFQGADLRPLWTELTGRATGDAKGAGVGMDLAVIAQILGDKAGGLAIQRDFLKLHQLFSSGRHPGSSSLRVLALAAASDIGANTPIEFLIQGQDISVATLYLGPDVPSPAHIPAHDVAIVVAPGSEDGAHALNIVEQMAAEWPVPILNRPARVRDLERDQLYHKLHGVDGLAIPPTLRVDRDGLKGRTGLDFPLIIRPVGSHAGVGLAKLDQAKALEDYLNQRSEDHFFISPYVDYASADGAFRKYRIAMIDGRAFPVHMAIADQWKVWYLNADMAASEAHRLEEARFMESFDEQFAARHAEALAQLTDRVGLDYLLLDCAETRDGRLLIFEADHCAIVHDMDPVNVYPYKPASMRKLFDAFGAMLRRRAAASASRAA